MEHVYEFISHSQSIIYLLITIGGWVIFLYKQSKRPEQEQNERINEIYQMLTQLKVDLENLQISHLGDIKVTIKLLLRREFNRMCLECLKKGYCTLPELDNIETMYHEYHDKYKMDGKGDELYKRVLNLDIKDDQGKVKYEGE